MITVYDMNQISCLLFLLLVQLHLLLALSLLCASADAAQVHVHHSVGECALPVAGPGLWYQLMDVRIP